MKYQANIENIPAKELKKIIELLSARNNLGKRKYKDCQIKARFNRTAYTLQAIKKVNKIDN